MVGSESDDDLRYMRLALDLAARGRGAVEPNPMVGCVIVRDDQVIGQGYHREFGREHAEVNALNALENRSDAKGATAYVTLEPCCHHGKTPPCSEALIAAGISRVVIAMQDPFGQVDGGGLNDLRRAGIEVVTGVLESSSRSLNAPYLKLLNEKRPYVISKWAMTIDGKIATVSGESQWITNSHSRGEVHQLRGRVDAIIVGMGTVRADNPTLTARPLGQRVANRIVFCKSEVPSINSNLVTSVEQAPLLLVAASSLKTDLHPLEDLGVEVFRCQGPPTMMVAEALDFLGERSMTNVMLEGGGELQSSFLLSDLVDECHVYIGAKLFGGHQAPGPVGGFGFGQLADATAWKLIESTQFENDLRLIYRRDR